MSDIQVTLVKLDRKRQGMIASDCQLLKTDSDPHELLNNVTTWSDNEVHELIVVKVLHTSLLNTTVVTFKVLPLGSYAPMLAPSPPFKTILELVLWNGLAFRAAVALLLMSSMSSKCLPVNISFIFGNKKKIHWGLILVNLY
jgi:hypothetical protein